MNTAFALKLRFASAGGTMIKRTIPVLALASLLLYGCGSVAYVPSSAKMDARAAQEQVRTLLIGRAAFIMWIDGDRVRVSDVRFRSDGWGLLIENSGTQTMHACYSSAIDHVHMTYVPLGRDGFGGPQYAVGAICSSGGAAWFDSRDDAQRLADALYTIKNRAR